MAGAPNRTAYRQCLTAHGIPANAVGGIGRGGGGGAGTGTGGTSPSSSIPRTLPPGVTQSQLQAAVAACRSVAPQGNLANSPQAAAYRNCLTVNGVTVAANGGLGTLNRSDPKVAAALTACAALRPARPGGSTTVPATTGASTPATS